MRHNVIRTYVDRTRTWLWKSRKVLERQIRGRGRWFVLFVPGKGTTSDGRADTPKGSTIR